MRKILRLQVFLLLAFLGICFSSAFSQTGTVQGTVSDKKTGEKLPGANVYVEGTSIGISSDIDGKFKLKVPAGKFNLIISYTGYQRQTVQLTIEKDQTLTHDFILTEDKMMLDEVVVIGFGTKRKRDITSSISSVKAEEIKEIPVENFSKMLVGRAPGVYVKSDNGLAGGGVTIRVRGTSSILGTSEPLYVVDGVPIIAGGYTNMNNTPEKGNVLAFLNPDDIASIEFLKDAAAAAIYGARSANGVILITTKKGTLTEGPAKTSISLDYYAGFSNVTNKLKVLNGSEYLSLAKQAWFNSGKGTEEQFYENLPYGIYNKNLTYDQNKSIIDNTSTNWIDESLQTGYVESASLNASGGNNKTQYLLQGSYYDEMGVIKKSNFKRFNARTNFSHKAFDILTYGTNIGLSYSVNDRVPTSWAGGLGTAQSRSLPIMPIYTATGGYFNPLGSNQTNTAATRDDFTAKVNSMNILGNIFGELRFAKWLWLREEFGLDNIYVRDKQYQGSLTLTPDNSYAYDQRDNLESYNNNLTLNFDKTFRKHNVTVLAGFQAQNGNEFGNWVRGANFPSTVLHEPGDASIITAGNWVNQYGFISWLGRASYSFNNKYYFSFSLRRDASSRFAPDHKWGWFPAASAGWTITEEKFITDNVKKVLSFLKLRGSYGLTGNAEIGNYAWYGSYTATSYEGLPGIQPGTVYNPKLGWETTAQFDIGIDFGLYNGRFSGVVDYYNKDTKDLLLNVNIPQTSGFSTVTKNVGSVSNKGIELGLTSNNFMGKFKWITEFNIANNINKIISIEGQVIAGETFGNNYAQEGHPIGAWRLVPYAGVDPKTGQELFYLANGSVGPWDDADANFFAKNAIVTGNPYPTWWGGINNTFKYVGFDLSVMVTFQWGNNIYRDDGKFLEGGQIGSNWNQMTSIENAWQKPGDVTNIPQLLWTNTYGTHNSTRYLDDGRFIRVKNITLGYSLPSDIVKKIHLEGLRVYIQAENWLTFTKYKGWDPEVNRDYSGNITQGVTYLSPPQIKTMTVGVNFNF